MRKLLVLLAAIFLAAPAHAFCGFYVSDSGKSLYNNATQVALMRDGTRTVLSMQNAYEGPPERFALVVPVPVVLQKDNVKTLPRDFSKLEQLDAPRLVEYWEQDPCAQPRFEEGALATRAKGHGAVRGADSGAARSRRHGRSAVHRRRIRDRAFLSAEDSGGLDTWLRRDRSYNIPPGAEPYLRPLRHRGLEVLRREGRPAEGHVRRAPPGAPLAASLPLRQRAVLRSPIRLGLLNAKDAQDLIIHVLAKAQRYEAANYANVAIPTNLDVQESAKGDFASVYNALFDDTIREHPRSVVTEYSWDASTCDPCPGPALSMQDVATLGADVAPSQQQAAQGSGVAGRGRRFWRGGWVLTRLHARYTKEALGDDLVFRAAPPIVGGREMRAFGASLEQTPMPSSFNNFQARYAIRHPWTGEIKCEHPVRDVWGGPPSGHAYEPPSAATKLAFSDWSASKLSSFVGYHAQPVTTQTAPAPSSSTAAATTPTAPSKSGCGCTLAKTSVPLSVPLVGSTFLVLFWIRRRSRP